MESKALAIIRILNILEEYSDENHPLTHEQIAYYLERNYGIVLERKAIGRHINCLIEMFDNDAMNKKADEAVIITSTRRKGTYIEKRVFENSELRMLIDGVLSSKYINANQSKMLISKLGSLSNKYFKSNVKGVFSISDRNKTENYELFYNIELIDEAIKKGNMIQFTYNKYGIDKKLSKKKVHLVSPYQLILHNQRYFLMSRNENFGQITNYRLDKITDMKIIEDSSLTDIKLNNGYENGIDYKDLATARPYMFTDKAEKVTFTTTYGQVDEVIDWFGRNIEIVDLGKHRVQITLKVSINAMKYWALQFLDSVEIISPVKLREQIQTSVRRATKKYDK